MWWHYCVAMVERLVPMTGGRRRPAPTMLATASWSFATPNRPLLSASVMLIVSVTVCALAGCSDGSTAEIGSGTESTELAGPATNEPTSPVPLDGGATSTSIDDEPVPEPVAGELPVPDTVMAPGPALPVMVLVDDTVYDLSTEPATAIWTDSDVMASGTSPPTVVDGGVLALVADPQSVPDEDAATTGILVIDNTETGERNELARQVSSFVVAPAGGTFAWTQPEGDVTRVMMAELPYGRITSSFVFEGIDSGPVRTTGRAEVVGIAGSNAVIRAGDPGGEVLLVVWVPELETTYRTVNFDPWSVGPMWANRLVLGQADTGCGVVVTIDEEGPASPNNGAEARPDLPCNASRAATISHQGTLVAGAGTTGETAIEGDPIAVLAPSNADSNASRLRLRVDGVPGAYWQPRQTRWLDDQSFVILASSHNGEELSADDFARDPEALQDPRWSEKWRSHWGLYRCDLVEGGCDLVRSIGFQPLTTAGILLVPVRLG